MKLTQNAKNIFDSIGKDGIKSPYDREMWNKFAKETGNWSVGVHKTAVLGHPNTWMLTSQDAKALKAWFTQAINENKWEEISKFLR